jgi:hypothetical protein
MMVVIVCFVIATQVKSYLTGQIGPIPFWVIPVGAVLATLAAMTEMSATVKWNDKFIRMYARWGFNYLGGKAFEVAIYEITGISAGYMSNEALGGKPFSTIEITDGVTAIPIRTDNFFREGMQQLVVDVARLRPDLKLADNLQAYIRGEFDSDWS